MKNFYFFSIWGCVIVDVDYNQDITNNKTTNKRKSKMSYNPWEEKATSAEVEGTQGPTFGGGYRVTVFSGKKVIASCHFPVPKEFRNWMDLNKGIDAAYNNAKKYLAGFGLK